MKDHYYESERSKWQCKHIWSDNFKFREIDTAVRIMVKIVIMVEMVIMVRMVIMVEIVITLQDKMAYTLPLATPPI